ncbi:carcinoembryonic antigen-related cell adhesion molecule 5-like isoform X1 [Seriola aureovittata]|uniref:carcinoembryonic antigen-related cell adhesion molecule 5-like isoform X1 n=1 Tax=Seriola aureovittata TaxID=2871759 RepID=UPI0024BDB627|nr:carcinoembryonic antigen-related cell adhesion molecule 5-like isoform X1 [Seriola aureovittata]
MDILILLYIVSVAFTGATGQQVEVEPEVFSYPGQTVNLRCAFTDGTGINLSSVTWSYESKEGNMINIAVFQLNFDPHYPDSPVKGRVSFSPSPPNLDSSSIQISDVRMTDDGNYICSIFTFPAGNKEGTTSLVILERVSNVTVTASSTDLVEFSSVSLSCSSSGSSLSFLWLNGSSEVTASDRVQLTDGNTTLTIVSVTRYDQGPFRCHVFNAVSNDTSAPINLSISFGPENIHLTKSPSQDYYVEGSDISLMCSAVSRPAALFNWFLNRVPLSDTGRELRLINIKEDQSGNYSCQAFNNKTMRNETSQPSVISVLTRVSNVIVTASSTDLVEFSSVSLFCSSSGSSLSFLWLNGSSEVTASDRVQLTDGNSTLTIVSVTRYDQGPFRCHVFNPFSNDTSAPINLSISYGPENINLTLCPSQEYYVEGSDISLMCSAVSRPAALFNWFLNRVPLSDTGPELRLINIQESQSGNYSCQAFNNKTLSNQTSQPSVVSVLEPIVNASVTSSPNQPVEGNSVKLTCEAAGSVFARKWMKDGADLIQTGRVLSFQSLKKTDSGKYSCNISNPVSSVEAEYIMVVNYGPENVQIKGPSTISLNENLTLTCSAESTPTANFSWKLNETKILNNSAVLTKHITDLSDSGEYTCEAMNRITEKTSSAVHGLTVTQYQTVHPSCSTGCIVGIVIACCVVIVVCILLVLLYIKKKKKSPNRDTGTRTAGEGQNNAAYSGSQELNYADIRFFQNKNGGTVNLGLQNNTSEYAEVRVNNGLPAVSSPPTYDAHMQRRTAPAP